jgi:ParB-like chromosome segregation protein Spo0J
LSSNESGKSSANSNSINHDFDFNVEMQAEWIPVEDLKQSYSPRSQGEDPQHTRLLADSGAKLPPIIVHRSTMRVIDGVHRLSAARMRGDETIEACLFDGSDQEAFVLGVKLNVSHGLPLSLSDRTAAAERIVMSQRTWSDRAIAEATGLGAKTIATIRRRLSEQGRWGEEEVTARVGRDGRVRPVDSSEGRLKAVEFIKNRPEASLREVARNAGVSPATVRDVRNRMGRGEDPVPAPRSRPPGLASDEASSRDPKSAQSADLAALLETLKRDPSLRFTESGRTLLRCVVARAIRSDEWRGVLEAAPPHSSYVIAHIARQSAQEWLRIAERLDKQSQDTA